MTGRWFLSFTLGGSVGDDKMMRGRLAAILGLALLVRLTASALAQEAPFPVDAHLDHPEVTVGEEFRLRFGLPETLAPGSEVLVDRLPDGITLKGAAVEAPTGGASAPVVVLRLSAFDFDLKEVPALTVSVRPPEGHVRRYVTPALGFAFHKVTDEQEKEMMDIQGPRGVGLSWWKYLLYSLLIVAIGMAAWWYWKRRAAALEGAAPQLVSEPPVPPHERALASLVALEREDLPRQGRGEEHVTRLSGIFRIYLEGRFHFLALEQTSTEIEETLPGVSALSEMQRQEILRLLREWDLIKFARTEVRAERARQLLEEARGFVMETKPTFLEEAALAGGSEEAAQVVREALG